MDVIIVDDMIASGESMLDVAAQLKQKGAKRIFAFSTFGLFTSGPDKFDQAYKDGLIDRIFTTNLTYTNPEVLAREWHVSVDMCKYVAYIIDTLNHDDTLSELLNPVKRIHKLVEKHKKDLETQVQIKFDN